MPFDNQAYLEPAVDPAAEHNHILDEMKRVLDEHGWCKYDLENDQGEVCVLGALLRSETACHNERAADLVHNTFNRLVGTFISSFNNLPTTTRADIDALLEKARL